MPERDANDPSSAPPHTPRVSGEVPARLELVDSTSTPLPESSLRAAPQEAPAPSEPSDTLLSAGKPADRLELVLEDKLAVVDERMRELEQRVTLLEQRRSTRVPEAPRSKPWLWLVFLLALVVVFQLLRRVR